MICTTVTTTAIPAFGFEGHILAAVSRGPAPGRSRGWPGPAFDRSHSRADDVFFFFFFLPSSIQRSDEDWRLLAFLSSSITSTDKKLFSNQKKGHASALPASVAGSSYLSSSKVKNKDRWTTNGIDRTVSVEHTERLSSRKALIEREGHFPCPTHGTGL